MFHLFTHAFFKSLLFLGAGVVIHLIHSNEMKDLGGLRKRMPITHITFLFGCLAIAGIPPFAGFFSKEEILLAAWESNKIIYFMGLITSGITAFYMFRLYFSIFWNKPDQSLRFGETQDNEGSLTMKIPLILLAIGTIVAGFIPFSHFVSSDKRPYDTALHLTFSVAPVLLALAGIGIAWNLYGKANARPEAIATRLSGFYRAAYKKFYIDELYLFVTKKIIFNLVGRPAAWIDRHIVDGAMNGIAWTTGKFSFLIRGMQSGRVQTYVIYFFGGVIFLALLFVYWWK